MNFNKILIYLLVLTVLTSCTNKEEAFQSANGQTKETIVMSAAASLLEPLTEIKSLFIKANPNVNLIINFGSSGSLTQQIEQGADVDLFFSASPKYISALIEQGLMAESSVTPLLENRLALITNINNDYEALDFSNLQEYDFNHIAIGDIGSVPVGQYAKEVFEYYSIFSFVKSHAVFGKDVKEVLTWVETENAELGVVYATDAQSSDQVKVLSYALPETHKKIVYPIGILKNSKHLATSELFMAFLKSEAAQNIFTQYGFVNSPKEDV